MSRRNSIPSLFIQVAASSVVAMVEQEEKEEGWTTSSTSVTAIGGEGEKGGENEEGGTAAAGMGDELSQLEADMLALDVEFNHHRHSKATVT